MGAGGGLGVSPAVPPPPDGLPEAVGVAGFGAAVGTPVGVSSRGPPFGSVGPFTAAPGDGGASELAAAPLPVGAGVAGGCGGGAGGRGGLGGFGGKGGGCGLGGGAGGGRAQLATQT